MTARPEIRSSETVYAGRRIHVRVDRLVTAAGAEVVREVVEHPGAVVIVPVLPDRRVVLVRQYRHPVGRTLLELPAGMLESTETPARCALRELAEETGYSAGKLTALGAVYPSPGILSEVMHHFLAEDLVPGDPDPDPGEEIEIEMLSLHQVALEVRNGGIRDGKTIIGLALAGLLPGLAAAHSGDGG